MSRTSLILPKVILRRLSSSCVATAKSATPLKERPPFMAVRHPVRLFVHSQRYTTREGLDYSLKGKLYE